MEVPSNRVIPFRAPGPKVDLPDTYVAMAAAQMDFEGRLFAPEPSPTERRQGELLLSTSAPETQSKQASQSKAISNAVPRKRD